MARLLHHLVEPPHDCPYLPDKQAQLEIRVQVEVAPFHSNRPPFGVVPVLIPPKATARWRTGS